MKEIELTKGYKALVDDEDYPELSKHKWCVMVMPRTKYAYRSITVDGLKDQISIKMHREICGLKYGDKLQVDHINHNGLDNRKENLRVCTASQNRMNTNKENPGKFGYKGVSLIGGRNKNKPYRGQLRFGNKHYHLGTFKTPEEAARAYDEKARELFGEYACLNFASS